ncbi:MAG: gamma carbonic anhydrase family protein [Saprospiraceae bacterium]|nr:gamma carbonic anhydrase family protein [Saprospiraceae bacterium]
MPLIQKVRGYFPLIHPDSFVADNATLTGDVVIGPDCSIWYNAIIRGDVNSIRIGHKVNVQDGVIIHCTFQKSITVIGDRVSIGHGAIIHGCVIDSDVLIGMGAIVMDNVHIPSRVIVGAASLIPENQILESGYIYAGVPAKKLKPIDEKNFDFFIKRTAANYQMYASWVKEASSL